MAIRIKKATRQMNQLPVYQHDRPWTLSGCDGDWYIGHYYGCDVYVTQDVEGCELDRSIICRYGNDGCEYGSQSVELLRQSIVANGNIGDCNPSTSFMSFQDYLFSDKATNFHKAAMIGLALIG